MIDKQYGPYSTAEVAAIYDISLETVRIWCSEFERHLSPRANPGHRQKRIFNEDDMAVFALVATLKNEGYTYQDIHNSLDNGERGMPPSRQMPDTIAVTEREKNFVARISHLEEQLSQAIEENERLKEEMTQIRQGSLRHEVRAEMLEEQLNKSEKRMLELLEERAKLERQIGAMESKLQDQSEPKPHDDE